MTSILKDFDPRISSRRNHLNFRHVNTLDRDSLLNTNLGHYTFGAKWVQLYHVTSNKLSDNWIPGTRGQVDQWWLASERNLTTKDSHALDTSDIKCQEKILSVQMVKNRNFVKNNLSDSFK